MNYELANLTSLSARSDLRITIDLPKSRKDGAVPSIETTAVISPTGVTVITLSSWSASDAVFAQTGVYAIAVES